MKQSSEEREAVMNLWNNKIPRRIMGAHLALTWLSGCWVSRWNLKTHLCVLYGEPIPRPLDLPPTHLTLRMLHVTVKTRDEEAQEADRNSDIYTYQDCSHIDTCPGQTSSLQKFCPCWSDHQPLLPKRIWCTRTKTALASILLFQGSEQFLDTSKWCNSYIRRTSSATVQLLTSKPK